MNNNIKKFKQIETKPLPNPDIIEEAEHILALAKSGSIQQLSYVAISHDGEYEKENLRFLPSFDLTYLGLLGMLKRDFEDEAKGWEEDDD